MIFKVLVHSFLSGSEKKVKMGGSIPDQIKPALVQSAVQFESRCREGAKSIIHLEAFLAKVMFLYKSAIGNSVY